MHNYQLPQEISSFPSSHLLPPTSHPSHYSFQPDPYSDSQNPIPQEATLLYNPNIQQTYFPPNHHLETYPNSYQPQFQQGSSDFPQKFRYYQPIHQQPQSFRQGQNQGFYNQFDATIPSGQENTNQYSPSDNVGYFDNGWSTVKKDSVQSRNLGWNQESDPNLLMAAVENCHSNWKKIVMSFLPRKFTIPFLKRKYKEMMNSGFKKRVKFTQEEDHTLVKLFQAHGTNWLQIAMEMPNRSPVMLKNRFYSFIRKNENYAKLLGDLKDTDKRKEDEEGDTGADSDYEELNDGENTLRNTESEKTSISIVNETAEFNLNTFQDLFKNLKYQIRNPISKPSKQDLLLLTDSLGSLLVDVSQTLEELKNAILKHPGK